MNFVHIVLDNAAHASTGNQPTATQQVPLEEMARVAGYRETSRVRNKDALIHALVRLLKEPGPTFLLVELELGDRGEAIPRVSLIPNTITNRIRSILAASSGAFP